MRVNLNDGSNVEVNLTAKMNASFTKDNFVISGGENDIKVPRADIKSFTFHEAARDGIENVGADNAAPVIDGDSMTFGNLPEIGHRCLCRQWRASVASHRFGQLRPQPLVSAGRHGYREC